MKITYETDVGWDLTLRDVGFLDDALGSLVISGVKISGTVPAATAGYFAPACIIQNIATGVAYINVGTTVNPVWKTIDTAGAGNPSAPVDSIQYNAAGAFMGDANFSYNILHIGEIDFGATFIFRGAQANPAGVFGEVGAIDATGSLYISSAGHLFKQIANAGAPADWTEYITFSGSALGTHQHAAISAGTPGYTAPGTISSDSAGTPAYTAPGTISSDSAGTPAYTAPGTISSDSGGTPSQASGVSLAASAVTGTLAQANSNQQTNTITVRLYTGTITGTPPSPSDTLLQAVTGTTGTISAVGVGYLDLSAHSAEFSTVDLVTISSGGTFTPVEVLINAFTLSPACAWLYYATSNTGQGLGQYGPTTVLVTNTFRQKDTLTIETWHIDGWTSITCGYVGIPTVDSLSAAAQAVTQATYNALGTHTHTPPALAAMGTHTHTPPALAAMGTHTHTPPALAALATHQHAAVSAGTPAGTII